MLCVWEAGKLEAGHLDSTSRRVADGRRSRHLRGRMENDGNQLGVLVSVSGLRNVAKVVYRIHRELFILTL